MAKRRLRPVLDIIRETLVWFTPVLFFCVTLLALYCVVNFQGHVTDCKERDLRFFGLIIQGFGFFLTAWSLSRDSAQDGRNAVINWFRSFPRFYARDVIVAFGAGTLTLDGLDARGSVSISDDVPLEVQVRAIKANLVLLFNEQGNISSKLRGLETNLKTEAQALHAKIDSRVSEIGQDLVDVRSGRASFELLGVAIFVVGSVLSTASPEIAFWAVGRGAALCP